MLTFVKGDIFKDDAEAIVIPVNCVGVAGAGVALAAKKHWPDWFAAYRGMCDSGNMKLRESWAYVHVEPPPIKVIFSLPTKGHWRDKSMYQDLNHGLGHLKKEIVSLKIETLALPALGCGRGGLSWAEKNKDGNSSIKFLMECFAKLIPNVDTRCYEPLDD